MAVNLQSIKEFRKYLGTELNDLYPDEEITAISYNIIEYITGRDRLKQLSAGDYLLTAADMARLDEIVTDLKSGKPVQYILGETIFYGTRIKVNSSTLIPRQETEELVDIIIKENSGFRGIITDLGTGSGCIAIALAKNLPEARIFALEISGEALETARMNSFLNNTDIYFLRGDLLKIDAFELPISDILVSNPPYVTESEKVFMHRNVLDFEPKSALFVPDSDPLLFYRAIANLAKKKLKPGGKIYLEINESMPARVSDLLEKNGFSGISVITDIHGKKRIIKGLYDV